MNSFRIISAKLMSLFGMLILFSGILSGQDSIAILSERVGDLYGKEKLVVLNQITEMYLQKGESKDALKYGKDARKLADNIINEENRLISPEDYYLKPQSYMWLGVAHL